MVAHQASADVAMLCRTLDYFSIERPELNPHCTLAIARRTIPDCKPHGLEALCRRFRIPLSAHNAASDAEAAGRLLLHMAGKWAALDSFFSKSIDGISVAEWSPQRR
jgi:DNA polymerase-3 subunit alpha (Gram-positive type)